MLVFRTADLGLICKPTGKTYGTGVCCAVTHSDACIACDAWTSPLESRTLFSDQHAYLTFAQLPLATVMCSSTMRFGDLKYAFS